MGHIFWMVKKKEEKKKKEGCTAKENKVGSINLNFMVGVFYNKGVVTNMQ